VTNENTEQRRPGRPRKDNPLSAAERQKLRRERQRKLEFRAESHLGDLTKLTSGLTELTNRLPDDSTEQAKADELRRFAERLLGEQRELVHSCLPQRRRQLP
jgi:hypothetical protein